MLLLRVKDNYSRKCISFICHRKLWGVVTKTPSELFHLNFLFPQSCCFPSFSPSLQVTIHLFCRTFIISLSLTHTGFFFSSLPLSYSFLLPQAPNRVASCVHEDKSMCCIPSCSRHPPHTNKAYLLLWPSLEKQWIHVYSLPGRVFPSSCIGGSLTPDCLF